MDLVVARERGEKRGAAKVARACRGVASPKQCVGAFARVGMHGNEEVTVSRVKRMREAAQAGSRSTKKNKGKRQAESEAAPDTRIESARPPGIGIQRHARYPYIQEN